jgi:hypothetical protein
METLVAKWGALNLVWPDRASATAALGRVPTYEERNLWKKLVKKTYGRSALKAGFLVFGRSLSLDEVAYIAKDPASWIQRSQEGKGLAPLLSPFVRVRQPAPQNFKTLRDGALNRGLTSLGWKWLCRQRPKTVEKLFAFGWTQEAIWWTNLLSKAITDKPMNPLWVENGRAYLQQSLYEILQHTVCPAERHQLALQIERLFRLVPAVADPKTMAEYEFISYAFLAGVRAPELQLSVAPGRHWTNLLLSVRRQNDKRAAMALELARDAAQTDSGGGSSVDASWPLRIGSGVLENIEVQELTHSSALEAEGASMTHCVGNGCYLQGCISGSHAVFSLREPISGMRSTLQLMLGDTEGFRIGQLAGPANVQVPQIFWKVARALASGIRPTPLKAPSQTPAFEQEA